MELRPKILKFGKRYMYPSEFADAINSQRLSSEMVSESTVHREIRTLVSRGLMEWTEVKRKGKPPVRKYRRCAKPKPPKFINSFFEEI